MSLRRDKAPRKDLAPWPNSAFMDACQLVRKQTKMEVVHRKKKGQPMEVGLSMVVERWEPNNLCKILTKRRNVNSHLV